MEGDPYDEEDYEHQYNQPAPISLEGCVAWFKAEEANVPWPSVVGSHEGKVVGKKAGPWWKRLLEGKKHASRGFKVLAWHILGDRLIP